MADGTTCGFTAEYVEIVNVSPHIVDLTGMTVGNGVSTLPITAGTLMLPGEVFVGASTSFDCYPGVEPDFTWGFLTFGGTGTFLVANATENLDKVNFGDFDRTVGAALSLDPRRQSASQNNHGQWWCAAVDPLDAVDLGSPGVANAECPDFDTAVISSCDSDDTDCDTGCNPAVDPLGCESGRIDTDTGPDTARRELVVLGEALAVEPGVDYVGFHQFAAYRLQGGARVGDPECLYQYTASSTVPLATCLGCDFAFEFELSSGVPTTIPEEFGFIDTTGAGYGVMLYYDGALWVPYTYDAYLSPAQPGGDHTFDYEKFLETIRPYYP